MGLESSVLKIKRAESLSIDLKHILDQWEKRVPFETIVERQEGYISRLSIRQRIPLPEGASLICGDIVHNLRCALDHLAWYEAKYHGFESPHIYFPVFSDERKFEKIISSSLKGYSKDFKVFLRSQQPFAGKNRILLDLVRLDNIDKHRVLNLISSVADSIDLRTNESTVFLSEINDSGMFGSHELVYDFTKDGMTRGVTDCETVLRMKYGIKEPQLESPWLPLSSLSDFHGAVVDIVTSTNDLFYKDRNR